MKTEKPVYQIDLTPTEENGLWIVRQQIQRGKDNWEETWELQFGTEEEADAFIDRWIAKQKSKA